MLRSIDSIDWGGVANKISEDPVKKKGKDRIRVRYVNQLNSKTFSRIVDTYQLDTKRVCDVGCGYGEMLFHFGEGSMGITIPGEEKDVMDVIGLHSVVANIEEDDLKEYAGQFDVVYCCGVIEHLFSPNLAIRKMRMLLKDGGLLILGVPVITTPAFLTRLKKFRGAFAQAHINFFTFSTFPNFVKEADCQIEAVRSFYFGNRFLDALFAPVIPQCYVVARKNGQYKENETKRKEKSAYTKTELYFEKG